MRCPGNGLRQTRKFANLPILTNNYIVVSKDADFRNSFFINHSPKKLIKISLGNITNDELIRLFTANIQQINKLAPLNTFLVEIDKTGLRVILK